MRGPTGFVRGIDEQVKFGEESPGQIFRYHFGGRICFSLCSEILCSCCLSKMAIIRCHQLHTVCSLVLENFFALHWAAKFSVHFSTPTNDTVYNFILGCSLTSFVLHITSLLPHMLVISSMTFAQIWVGRVLKTLAAHF